jgi:hypothetical protein
MVKFWQFIAFFSMGVVTENKSAKSIGLIAIGTMYIDQKYHF